MPTAGSRGPSNANMLEFSMATRMTAEDILPLIAGLTPQERARLLRLIVAQPALEEAGGYAASPPAADEFSSDEGPLAWEAGGWEEFY